MGYRYLRHQPHQPLYNKQQQQQQQTHVQKGGAVAPSHPPPPFRRAWNIYLSSEIKTEYDQTSMLKDPCECVSFVFA